jgi:hypothetical protein
MLRNDDFTTCAPSGPGNVTECNSHTLDHICHAYDWALRTSNDTATHNNYISNIITLQHMRGQPDPDDWG